MSFMSSYKHLDHLCQGMYPNARNGVSGYIEDMERQPSGSYRVYGWDEDYKALKHYRWVRNQIAHEEYADEETMCEPGDIEWLENFYQRIMNQTDPLALAYQASKPRVQNASAQQNHSDIPQHNCSYPQQKPKPIGCATLVIGAVLVVAAIALFLFL